jgi:hypothetical protein
VAIIMLATQKISHKVEYTMLATQTISHKVEYITRQMYLKSGSHEGVYGN